MIYGGKLKTLLKSVTKQVYILIPLLFDTGSTSKSFQTRKKNKGVQIGKEKVKLSLPTEDILYVETPQKLLELINELIKVARYKINLQCNKISCISMQKYTYLNKKRNQGKKISFMIASKIKYLEINNK
jgi:hypothetical protein